MSRFTVEDMQKLRRLVKSELPEDARLIEKIETELEVLTIRRDGRRLRKQRSGRDGTFFALRPAEPGQDPSAPRAD